MATVSLGALSFGPSLQTLLMCDEITPGAAPGYELCKIIYLYHPLGGKMADAPIRMAQSQKREISIKKGPEDRLKEAFLKEWEALGADSHIANVKGLSRVYGAASIGLIEENGDPTKPLDFEKLYKLDIAFNVFDPLNTAGSLILNQMPNQASFLKSDGIAVTGQNYNKSRTLVVFNEKPVHLAYTVSGFGYVGRSVYQRALFPLKSFISTMLTDDLVTKKAGVLIAKMKQVGSVVDSVMKQMFSRKAALLKDAETGSVLAIGVEEAIETLNMQNLDGAYGRVRSNILKNAATAADMPAKLLENETMVRGFGEGSEDAKAIADYIDGFRLEMLPLYNYFDNVTQWRAWNPEFYETIQADFPEYKNKPYKQAFFEWQKSFEAIWPNLLKEPESEAVKTDDVKLKGIIAVVEVVAPLLDPENKATLVGWMQDNLNDNVAMFQSPLILDIEALASYEPPQPDTYPESKEPKPQAPFSASDSVTMGLPALRTLLRRVDADFVESEHPRDNDGKFATAGGGGAEAESKPSPSSKSAEPKTSGLVAHESGKVMPAHIAALKIPPAWKDVRYNPDPKGALLAVGKDAKGREQRVYSAEFSKTNAEAKFRRIQELD